jgi:hypothetical protein
MTQTPYATLGCIFDERVADRSPSMKLKAPIITLLVGLVLAAGLYVSDINVSRNVAGKKAAADIAAAAPTSSPTPAASPTPAPAPSASAGGGSASAGGGAAAGSQNGVALAKATFAGAVDTGAAGLAIVQNNGKVLAYVCDGRKAEAWLSGTATDTGFTLTGAQGSLTGTYADGKTTGTVTAAGKTWHFTLNMAKAPSGLYRSASGVRNKLNASWAVTPDGKQWGVQIVDGVPGPAPIFDTTTDTVTVDGATYPVVPGDPEIGTN